MTRDDDTLTVYSPASSFPAVSVTGKGCDQMCEHCKGSHLKGMLPAESNDGMLRLIDEIVNSGGTGVLISGGCDIFGKVPLQKVENAIAYAASKDLKVNVHAGLINEKEAERLVRAGVSAFSVDVHRDPDIICSVLHLDSGPDAYEKTIDSIIKAGGRPVAHLTVGFGTADLMLSADLVKKKGLKDIILLALVPTKGTMTENAMISEDAIVDSVKLLIAEGFNVTLGCMRPRVHRSLEIRCIQAGVRHIANPSRGTISWARENGFRIVEKRTCCCIR